MIRYILTDIEGTTTSVSFVYEVLFPYFREEIGHYLAHAELSEEVKAHLDSVAKAAGLPTNAAADQLAEVLRAWSLADLKHTALKAIQGLVWRRAYEQGQIKGHVYADVAPNLRKWHEQGLGLGVYSSGSVAAQQLIFGYSTTGDLTPLFSHYFDTQVGPKREKQSYCQIAEALGYPPADILFLSDVTAELDAAAEAGFQTIQLVRPGTEAGDAHRVAKDFEEVSILVQKLSDN